MKNFRPQHRPKKSSLVAGRQAIENALKEGKSLDRIYLNSKMPGDHASQIRKLASAHQVPVNVVPVEKLNGFNIGDHGGVVALLSRVRYYDLQEVIDWVVEKGQTPLFLVLDGITDIRNIGAIARTAFSTGVQALVIPDKGVGALNEDAVLTSAGALEQLPVCRAASLMKAVDTLHLNGISVLASEMTAQANVYDIDLRIPVAIVMGSEENGIYPALMKICDQQFRIPMSGSFESLNVSVAAGMILYEAMKQRLTSQTAIK